MQAEQNTSGEVRTTVVIMYDKNDKLECDEGHTLADFTLEDVVEYLEDEGWGVEALPTPDLIAPVGRCTVEDCGTLVYVQAEPDRQISDTAAMANIHALLDVEGEEWDAGTIELVGEVVMRTGRVIRDPNEVEPVDFMPGRGPA